MQEEASKEIKSKKNQRGASEDKRENNG